MKKLIFAPFVMISFFASAQMSQLFYGNAWDDLNAFKDSIIHVLPAFNDYDIILSKSGNSEVIIFKDSSGKSIKADILKVTGSPDRINRISTIQLTGNLEPLVIIYNKYILRGKEPENKGAGNCWPVFLVTTAQGEMPVSFCKNLSKSNSWTLGNKIPILKR